MSNSQPQSSGAGYLVQAIVCGLCFKFYLELGPVMVAGEIRWVPAVLLCFGGVLGMGLVVYGLNVVAYFLEWLGSHQATGLEGTAQWGAYKNIKQELERKHRGPFWGMTVGKRQKLIFSNYASNSMTVAPAGSGKGIFTVVPMGLAIRFGKVFSDFKGELICILKDALEKRGETVRALNPAGLWSDIVGPSDSYNVLDIIVDCLFRGSLRDVMDDLRELTAQLYPEPGDQETDDSHWREGGRNLIGLGILIEAMVEGYDATLPTVALLLEDRKALEHNLRWIGGIDLEGKPLANGPMPIAQAEWAHLHSEEDMSAFISLVQARASNWLELMCAPDSKSFDSYLLGAQQALNVYAFGRLAPVMGRSTFSMDDLKDDKQITNLFIVADSSRMEVYKHYIGLIQWCALTAMKRHKNKKQPVYFILDEATNYKVHGLESLLTWGRGYGVRLHLIFQDLTAFSRIYGEENFETLLSETEIKQFLPGQRSLKTLELISKLLGDQGLMNASVSLRDLEGSAGEHMSEKARPLLKPDEVRRCPYGILIVRQALPILIEPVSYAQIHPWRKEAGINPFHGKPFKQKLKVRL